MEEPRASLAPAVYLIVVGGRGLDDIGNGTPPVVKGGAGATVLGVELKSVVGTLAPPAALM